MSMSRKDYVAIAKLISDAQFVNCPSEAEVNANKEARIHIAQNFAKLAEADNPRFDAIRFFNACNI